MKLADVKASQNPHLAVLTAKELEWVENYEADYGPYYAYNLSQNPRVIGMKSTRDALGNPTLFALLKSGGLIWYNDRFYTPSERLGPNPCSATVLMSQRRCSGSSRHIIVQYSLSPQDSQCHEWSNRQRYDGGSVWRLCVALSRVGRSMSSFLSVQVKAFNIGS